MLIQDTKIILSLVYFVVETLLISLDFLINAWTSDALTGQQRQATHSDFDETSQTERVL